MARAPRQPKQAAAPAIDPNARYRVYVNKVVRMGKYGNVLLAPRHENVLTGVMLQSLDPSDVERYELKG